MKKALFTILTLSFLSLAGSVVNDTNETSKEYIYASMPDNVFESILLKLGDQASVEEIVDHYLANKKRYDSLKDHQVITY